MGEGGKPYLLVPSFCGMAVQKFRVFRVPLVGFQRIVSLPQISRILLREKLVLGS